MEGVALKVYIDDERLLKCPGGLCGHHELFVPAGQKTRRFLHFLKILPEIY